MTGELESLWEQYRGLTIADLPEVVQLAASQCILDVVGCALWGSREPLAQILVEEFRTKDDDATIIGTRHRASVPVAALINGAAAHALDFDDTNLTGRTHYTAATLPAALAEAEARGMSGADLLVAYVVGIEVGCRLRVVIGEEPYARGWHSTSSAHAALAAVGWLSGIDPAQFRQAVGIAAASSAGVQANFGSMTKALHVGLAAEAGVRAARFAARGFTSGEQAFAQKTALTGGTVEWERMHVLGDKWVVTDTLFKKYVSGAGTQVVVDATRRLDVAPEEVERAEIRVAPAVMTSGYAQFPVPASGLQAKFSPAAVMTLTLLGHNPSSPDTFSDENIGSQAFRDLIEKVEMVEDRDITDYYIKRLVVETKGGTRSQEVRSNRDSGPVEPWTADLRAKFDTLAGAVVGERAKELGDLIMKLPSVRSVTDICEHLVAT